MYCESCKEKKSKFMRELNNEKVMSNIFLCEDCEKKYEAGLEKSSEEKVA